MKILLAIDGSKWSESAVDIVLEQYSSSTCEVLVLHAIETLKLMPTPTAMVLGPFMVEDYFAMQEQWKKDGEQFVAQIAKRLEGAGFKTIKRVQEGDARDLILKIAEEWKPDLILLGSQGKRGLDRLLLGSVAEAVARQAACSVEIVRTPA